MHRELRPGDAWESERTPATCPLCHADKVGGGDVAADGWWRCARCGQAWTDARLATVAAYTAHERERTAEMVPPPDGPRLVRARA